MPINFFTIINSVLNQLIYEICRNYRISENEAIEIAKQFLVKTSDQYFSDEPSIEYEDPLCRLAYLYTYVGAHANLIDISLRNIIPLTEFILEKIHNSQQLSICSLGGGPGSELLGFVKYIDRVKNVEDKIDIHFLLIDKIAQWDDSWNALFNGLENLFNSMYGKSQRDWPININHSFLNLDLVDAKSFGGFLTRFSSIELFLLNHTISELINHPDEFQIVFDTIVSKAPDNAYFLIVDRNQKKVVDFVNKLINENSSLIKIYEMSENNNMDLDEQKTDLGKWYEMMKRDPKLSWNAYYCFAQKISF